MSSLMNSSSSITPTTNKRAAVGSQAERPSKRIASSTVTTEGPLINDDGVGASVSNPSGRTQRNKSKQVRPIDQLGNLSETLTAKPVRAKSKRQQAVLDNEEPNPMAQGVGRGRRGSRGGASTRGGRGRGGRGAKQGSVSRAPVGLKDIGTGSVPTMDASMLTAYTNFLNNPAAQSALVNTATQELLRSFPQYASPNFGHDVQSILNGQLGLPDENIQATTPSTGLPTNMPNPSGSMHSLMMPNMGMSTPRSFQSTHSQVSTMSPDAMPFNNISSVAQPNQRGSLLANLMDPNYPPINKDLSPTLGLQTQPSQANGAPFIGMPALSSVPADSLLQSAASDVASVLTSRDRPASSSFKLPSLEDDSSMDEDSNGSSKEDVPEDGNFISGDESEDSEQPPLTSTSLVNPPLMHHADSMSHVVGVAQRIQHNEIVSAPMPAFGLNNGIQNAIATGNHVQQEVHRSFASSFSLGTSEEQNVLTSHYKKTRRPRRAPDLAALSAIGATAAGGSAAGATDGHAGITNGSAGGVGVGGVIDDADDVIEEAGEVTGQPDAAAGEAESDGETFDAFFLTGGRRKRTRKTHRDAPALSREASRGASLAPSVAPSASSRSRSVSTAPTLVGTDMPPKAKNPSSKLVTEIVVEEEAVEDGDVEGEDEDEDEQTKIKFEDLPAGWQEIVKMTKLTFRDHAATVDGFLVKHQAAEKIHEFLLENITTFRAQGGVLEDGIYDVYLDDLITFVWKDLATFRNDLKGIARYAILNYPSLQPVPGLTREQQAARTRTEIRTLLGPTAPFHQHGVDGLGHRKNWCNPVLKTVVLNFAYATKSRVANHNRPLFSQEVPKRLMALVATAVICVLMEWSSGKKKLVRFKHERFNGLYRRMIRSIATLEDDPYQAMKMAETRQEWAGEGMDMLDGVENEALDIGTVFEF